MIVIIRQEEWGWWTKQRNLRLRLFSIGNSANETWLDIDQSFFFVEANVVHLSSKVQASIWIQIMPCW